MITGKQQCYIFQTNDLCVLKNIRILGKNNAYSHENDNCVKYSVSLSSRVCRPETAIVRFALPLWTIRYMKEVPFWNIRGRFRRIRGINICRMNG